MGLTRVREDSSFGGSWQFFLSEELERRVLRRRGSCVSNDCKEQSFDRGDRDRDELRLEEGDLTAVLPLEVLALATLLRPRVVFTVELEVDVLFALLGLALAFFASTFSASRGERRRGWLDGMGRGGNIYERPCSSSRGEWIARTPWLSHC